MLVIEQLPGLKSAEEQQAHARDMSLHISIHEHMIQRTKPAASDLKYSRKILDNDLYSTVCIL